MSKIIRAANVMVAFPNKITEVSPASEGEEIFFRYDNKSVWSIINSGEEIALYCYPKATSAAEVARVSNFKGMPLVRYSTETLNTREARATFRDLYNTLREKVYGMDVILEDILSEEGSKNSSPNNEIPF